MHIGICLRNKNLYDGSDIALLLIVTQSIECYVLLLFHAVVSGSMAEGRPGWLCQLLVDFIRWADRLLDHRQGFILLLLLLIVVVVDTLIQVCDADSNRPSAKIKDQSAAIPL